MASGLIGARTSRASKEGQEQAQIKRSNDRSIDQKEGRQEVQGKGKEQSVGLARRG